MIHYVSAERESRILLLDYFMLLAESSYMGISVAQSIISPILSAVAL